VLCDARVLAAENNAQLSVVHVLHFDRKYAALELPFELNLERIAAQKEMKSLVDKLGPEQRSTRRWSNTARWRSRWRR
jgi:hypothetical protein